MKFILLAAIVAIAFSTAGDVTSIAATATFYNTTGKVADAMCQLAVTASMTAAYATAGTVFSPIWLVNDKTQHSVVVNDTILYVQMSYTYAATPTWTVGTATAAMYVASSAVTIGSSAAVTSSNTGAIGSLTTGSSAVSSTGVSWTTSFNLTYTQSQYFNSSNSNIGSFFPYFQAPGASSVAYTAVLSTNAIGTSAVAITSFSTCTAGYVKLASGSTSIIDRLLGSVLAFSFF